MNVKVRAGLEVVGFFVVAIVIGGLTKLGLDYFAEAYGEKAVINAMIFCGFAGFFYFVGGILYDIRLSQLRYKEKLEEMTKK